MSADRLSCASIQSESRNGGEEGNQFFTVMYTLLLLLYTPAPVALCVHGVSIGDDGGGRGNTTRCQQNTASAGMTDDVNGLGVCEK